MRKSLRNKLLEGFEFRFYFDDLRLGVNVALNEETVAQMVLYVNDNMRVIVRMPDSKALPLTRGGDPCTSALKRLMLCARYVARTPQCVRRVVDGLNCVA